MNMMLLCRLLSVLCEIDELPVLRKQCKFCGLWIRKLQVLLLQSRDLQGAKCVMKFAKNGKMCLLVRHAVTFLYVFFLYLIFSGGFFFGHFAFLWKSYYPCFSTVTRISNNLTDQRGILSFCLNIFCCESVKQVGFPFDPVFLGQLRFMGFKELCLIAHKLGFRIPNVLVFPKS